MKKHDRREFLTRAGLTIGAVTLGGSIAWALQVPGGAAAQGAQGAQATKTAQAGPAPFGVDFRFAPGKWQSTYCFPDDPWKSIVGNNGELLCGHPGLDAAWDAFAQVVSIELAGPGNVLSQKIESPGIPIITTELSWDEARIRLTSFATNRKDEGRVDNLLIEAFPRSGEAELSPQIVVAAAEQFTATADGDRGMLGSAAIPVFLSASATLTRAGAADGAPARFALKPRKAKQDDPARFLLRLPQEKQKEMKADEGDARDLIDTARAFWRGWSFTAGTTAWQMGEVFQDFSVACARNIVESREIKNGKKIFQVGPTCYRGLWMVDGYSLLEAARYLGYDKEAQEGLESIWDRQAPDGSITGGAGNKHYKDTPVAIFTAIRQAELSQNWDFFNELYPDMLTGVSYLRNLRDKARWDGTANGRYEILPQGFGDSGIGGVRSEFTNTLWALVALKKLVDIAKRFSLEGLSDTVKFYGELRAAFYKAANGEMRKDPKGGFYYLPMLMAEDPRWNDPDEKKRPRPQAAQIYLSQAIYPGMFFLKEDKFVGGHVSLMRSVTTNEDIPIETGWLAHDAVWPYNAAILAQTYLWLGMTDLARKTFIGFLNHASPLYAWREEQSLHGVEPAEYIGDMPHNWASAECIRYLRHMMILEDEKNLRLFDGIALPELDAQKPLILKNSPTRWGRVLSVTLEPVDRKNWRTTFTREGFDEKTMPPFAFVEMPRKLPGGLWFDTIKGATRAKNGERILVPGASTSWECTWRSL